MKKFKFKKIALDTAPFIYFIEEHSEYISILTELFISNSKGKLPIVSSTITLLEVLVLPYKLGKADLAERYENILTGSDTISLIDVNKQISRIAAQLRAEYKLRTPDAIQIATAIYAKADCFITNDKQLKSVKEIQILTMDDLSKNGI